MNCCDPICRIISCPPTDDLPSYYGQYSLQSGVSYENGAIIVPAPGGGSYTVPPGTIVINLPPGSTSVNYQGCQSSISLPIPTGSSPAEIQAIVSQVMQQAAAQLAICNAPTNPHSGGPFPPTVFSNIGIGINCPGGLAMKQISPLPGIVTLSGDSLFLDAGNFSSSVSESDANAMAQAFLESLIGTKVQCGYWNTEQSFTCPDTSVQTVPARTYFSTVSQAAADALALAAAEAACPSGNLIILIDDEVTGVLSRFCRNIQSLAGNLYFCDKSSNNVFASTDGLNWASVLNVVWHDAYDIAYGAGVYVVVGHATSSHFSTYTSSDAVSWTHNTTTVATNSFDIFWSIAYGSGTFVVGMSTGKILTSPDGFTWASQGVVGPADEIDRVRYVGGFFFAIYPFSNALMSSADGMSWSNSRTAITYNFPRDIAYGNSKYVVVGQNFVYSSSDLVTWTTTAFPHECYGCTFGNGVFTVVTHDKLVFTSPDGITWTDSGRTAFFAFGAVTMHGTDTVAAEAA